MTDHHGTRQAASGTGTSARREHVDGPLRSRRVAHAVRACGAAKVTIRIKRESPPIVVVVANWLKSIHRAQQRLLKLVGTERADLLQLDDVLL